MATIMTIAESMTLLILILGIFAAAGSTVLVMILSRLRDIDIRLTRIERNGK